jgi:hypothetical protein
MLHTVDRFQVPGVVEARRGDIVKRVYVREGYVVHATSSDRGDSLGSYLQRTGKISSEQFRQTMEARAGSKKRYGELMIEAELISPGEIHEAIRKQIESIVWSLFYWQTGEVRFDIGSFDVPSSVKILLPMRHVILEGIKRAPNAKALVARLGRKETVFEPDFTTEDLIRSALGSEEYSLIQLVDGKRSLYEICHEGPLSAPENAKLIYAFHVLRLVRRRQAAPTEEAAPSAAATEDPQPKGIKIKFKTGADRLNESGS